MLWSNIREDLLDDFRGEDFRLMPLFSLTSYNPDPIQNVKVTKPRGRSF